MIMRYVSAAADVNVFDLRVSLPYPTNTESAVELLVYVTERCSDVVSAGHVPTLLGAYSASCSKTGESPRYSVEIRVAFFLSGENAFYAGMLVEPTIYQAPTLPLYLTLISLALTLSISPLILVSS